MIISIFLVILSYCKCDLVINGNDSGATLIKSQKTHYIVKVGETLVIPCEIENRKQATVIWQYSKSRIPETLTVGYFYYRKDFRIRVIANTTIEKEQSWNLEIRKVRLEDEGYYLCKVMAEPESLKRVIYLKVEVNLNVYPMNPIVNMEQQFNIICNTSYSPSEYGVSTKSSKSIGHQQASHPKIVWIKDGDNLQHLLDQNHLNTNNSQSVNYRIEYHTKPYLWSMIHIKSVGPANIGTYTCKFRHQNMSTTLKYPNGESYYSILF